MELKFTFTKTGSSWFAQPNNGDSAFLVGKEVLYKQRFLGLSNYSSPKYDASSSEQDKGFWAYFILPTAKAESNLSYPCVNSYDSARFTFGFLQYAAHVPDGDFVRFFRELLTLPDAGEYFPRLSLKDGRIFYTGLDGNTDQLEDHSSSLKLMNYLNPTRDAIENQELICTARFVHWATKSLHHRQIQVDFGVSYFKDNMLENSRNYGLDGYPAKICQLICDIRHQGRQKAGQIRTALQPPNDYDSIYSKLLQIGQPDFASRITTVKNEISRMESNGTFLKTYEESTNSFI